MRDADAALVWSAAQLAELLLIVTTPLWVGFTICGLVLFFTYDANTSVVSQLSTYSNLHISHLVNGVDRVGVWICLMVFGYINIALMYFHVMKELIWDFLRNGIAKNAVLLICMAVQTVCVTSAWTGVFYNDQFRLVIPLAPTLCVHGIFSAVVLKNLPPKPTLIKDLASKKYTLVNHSIFALSISSVDMDDQRYKASDIQKGLEQCGKHRGIDSEMAGWATTCTIVDPLSSLELISICPMDLNILVKFHGTDMSARTPRLPQVEHLNGWYLHTFLLVFSMCMSLGTAICALIVRVDPPGTNVLAVKACLAWFIAAHLWIRLPIDRFIRSSRYPPAPWVDALILYLSTTSRHFPVFFILWLSVLEILFEFPALLHWKRNSPERWSPTVLVEGDEMWNATDIPTFIRTIYINGLECDSVDAESVQSALNKSFERVSNHKGGAPKVGTIKQVLGPKERVVWIHDAPPDVVLRVEIDCWFLILNM